MTARVFYRRAGRLRRADRAQATLGHSRAAEARPNRRRAVRMVRTVDAATAHQCTSGGRHRRRYGRGSRDIVARRLRVARTCGWLAEVATEDGALRGSRPLRYVVAWSARRRLHRLALGGGARPPGTSELSSHTTVAAPHIALHGTALLSCGWRAHIDAHTPVKRRFSLCEKSAAVSAQFQLLSESNIKGAEVTPRFITAGQKP